MPPLAIEQDTEPAVKVYSWDEIRKHDKEGDAWVVKGGQVYDVSHFLKEHPGGAAIVMPHLGTDIDDVFEDDDLHMHSRAAHAMLLRFQIGVLAGAHSAERKRDGDGGRLYIDWSKPIVCQIGQLGERYNEFIHSPQVLDGPARFFQSNLLEALSRTPWYVVPIVWVPVIAGMLLFASTLGVAPLSELAIFSCGLALWTLIEYVLHRWLFHLDEHVPNYSAVLTVHFLLHGVHHLLPMDNMRLVFPPVLTALFLVAFFYLFRAFLDTPEALCLTAGGLMGYLIYDLTHYYLHHSDKPFWKHLANMKSYHLAHHYKNHEMGYGITSKFWDYVFGTVLDDRPAAPHQLLKSKAL